MSEESLKARALDHINTLPAWETFTPAGLQRRLRCGYIAARAVIDELLTEGAIKRCEWTFQRAATAPDGAAR